MYHYSEFHRLSKELSYAPESMRDWPETWKKPLYKVYQSAPIHALPKDNNESQYKTTNISEILRHRKTHRNLLKNKGIPVEILSELLLLSCGETGEILPGTEEKKRRTYASAGALYPIEVYLLLSLPNDTLSAGLYHYRPDLHALEELDVNCIDETLGDIFARKWPKYSSVTLFLTGVFDRSTAKYKERGYRFVLLEAGHIGANIALMSEALGLSSAEIGGTIDENIETLLDIDGVSEALLSTFVLGKPNG